MKDIAIIIEEELKQAFKKAGYEIDALNVAPCAIPEMGDFQCTDALSMAKIFHKAPVLIAQDVAKNVVDSEVIASCNVAGPGYLNLFVSNKFLSAYTTQYVKNIKNFDFENIDKKMTIIDYGGANVAKPLHVGHLRSANIGESIKRIVKRVGNKVLGDVHLGDWGLQMGMVISEIERRRPNLVYFDKDYQGEYPIEAPITIKDLETLYPEANAKAKADERIMEQAKQATFDLQNGRRGYVELWKRIIALSKSDLKATYDSLNVNFDLWLGESDTQKYYETVIKEIKDKGLAHESEGALVVDVANADDNVEVPPFILVKSDGAVLYSTTDLATIVQREKEFGAERIIYVVDNRQSLHFTQLFRCAEKTKITMAPIEYHFVGFGTMNGKDGRPYKTRDGGVMQLKDLIAEIKDKAMEKVKQAKSDMSYSTDEMLEISNKVAISALKYADLSIYRTKDYNFDPDKFCSFDGKTGPYILYTIARAKSILRKANCVVDFAAFDVEKCDRKLVNLLISYDGEILKAYSELAPSYICDFVYRLANQFNNFYAKCNIIMEKDEAKKQSLLALTQFSLKIMEDAMELLGIETLEKM